MAKTIALFGGSFDPPTLAHREVVERAAGQCNEVVVIPCGKRPDKLTVNDTPAIHRAIMCDLAFGDMPGVSVDLSDLEQNIFTRTFDLVKRYSDYGCVCVVVGADLVAGGSRGQSLIQKEWHCGNELWHNAFFLVVARQGYDLPSADMPPNHTVLCPQISGSSTQIRNAVFNHTTVPERLIQPKVMAHIDRYGLYRGRPAAHYTERLLPSQRFKIITDQNNPEAMATRKSFPPDDVDPNLIITCGGDGTMLNAIRNYWRRRIPFFGLNFGHRGFLLNSGKNFPEEIKVWHLPLLFVEVLDLDNVWHEHLAFNDAWIERAEGQTAWIEVAVNNEIRLPGLRADGILVATAAGSTSYANAMGVPALPVGIPLLVLAGSNVIEPLNWQYALLEIDSRIEFAGLDLAKRPIRAFVDGQPCGLVKRMRIRISRIASCELAFRPNLDIGRKLVKLQFPGSA